MPREDAERSGFEKHTEDDRKGISGHFEEECDKP
jgi:hypothetical protein